MEVILISIEASPSIFFPIAQEMLKAKGHTSKYIHIPLMGFDKITDEMIAEIMPELEKKCEGAGLVAISCMTNTYFGFVKIAHALKKKFDIPIIAGGIHPTMKPEECAEHADYVCVGEGEEVLMDVIERLEKGESVYDIDNLCYKKDGKTVKNPLRELSMDLDIYPSPTFNVETNYMYHNGKIKSFAEDPELIKIEYGKYYFIITSRGCPYKCKFCLNHALINIKNEFRRIRQRSKEHFMEELRNINKILPKGSTIGFVDDDFCARSTNKMAEIAEMYKKEIDVPFFCASTPTSMNEEKVQSLIKAGLMRLEIGVQSISDKVNHEIYNRPSNRDQLVATVKMLEKYRRDLTLCYDFILDNPWEKDDTRYESLDFALGLVQPVNLFLFSLTLYPGTTLYERAKQEGMIKNEHGQIYEKNHMLLNNSYVNTLFVLYTNYNVPKPIIRALIKTKDWFLVKQVIGNSTYVLFRASNFYTGLRDSVKLKDKEMIVYYLKAPFKSVAKTMQNTVKAIFSFL